MSNAQWDQYRADWDAQADRDDQYRKEQTENAAMDACRHQTHRTSQEPIMKFSQMIQGKYLKKEDLDEDVIVTVKAFAEQNVAGDGQPEDKKWVLYFEEYEKGMVLNSTNIQLLQNATGASGPDEAVGKEVILYVDPNVSFGGKIVGGIRIRAHKVAAPVRPVRHLPKAATRSPVSDSQSFADEDIPL